MPRRDVYRLRHNLLAIEAWRFLYGSLWQTRSALVVIDRRALAVLRRRLRHRDRTGRLTPPVGEPPTKPRKRVPGLLIITRPKITDQSLRRYSRKEAIACDAQQHVSAR